MASRHEQRTAAVTGPVGADLWEIAELREKSRAGARTSATPALSGENPEPQVSSSDIGVPFPEGAKGVGLIHAHQLCPPVTSGA